jgi:hypothetical protein
MDDAMRMVNHDLLQDVGISFYARAESIIAINKIHTQGIVNCPACRRDVSVSDGRYSCDCGWCIASKELHLTYKGKQATGLSIVEFAEKFIRDWNSALHNPHEQMRAIDFLIHRFHWEMTEKPTRPVAVNFIDGTMKTVTNLILELAYNDDITKIKNREEWLKNNELANSIWGRS